MEPQSNLTNAGWQSSLKRLAIWSAFIGLIYLTRDFFFLGFMTFMFSYLALTVIGRCMGRLAVKYQSPAWRRFLTLAVFVLIPIVLIGIGILVMPKLIGEAQRLAGWASQVSPEAEAARLLEQFVGPMRFRQQFGEPSDPRFQEALAKYRVHGAHHVDAYLAFPKFAAWMEAGFNRQFVDAERDRIRLKLLQEGTSSDQFGQWFVNEKVPELKVQAQQLTASQSDINQLVRAAASATPEQLLAQVRRDSSIRNKYRDEWIDEATMHSEVLVRQSPAYAKHFEIYYEQRRHESPHVIPYTFEQFTTLQNIRPQGQRAFGEAIESMGLAAHMDSEAQLAADFEAAKQHELFESWWSTSAVAKYVRQQLESGISNGFAARVEHLLATLLNIPIDLATALLLSFFICIDFPALKRGCQQLRTTWLRDVYDEIAPALTSLGLLVGRSLRAQGIIALCNATLMFVALTLLGVEHPTLLASMIFVLCLVPTIGMMIAWVLVAGVALIQPGGGFLLALKASAAVFGVVMLETFVFSPRILGKLMELHPVLIIAILPIAHYFFGIWGLVLALPVSVFIINDIILCRDRPGDSTITNTLGTSP